MPGLTDSGKNISKQCVDHRYTYIKLLAFRSLFALQLNQTILSSLMYKINSSWVFLCTYIFTMQGGDRVSMYLPRFHALLNLHQTRRFSVCMDRQTYSILSSERSQLFCLAGYDSSRIQHVLRRNSALTHITWCSSRSTPMVDIH